MFNTPIPQAWLDVFPPVFLILLLKDGLIKQRTRFTSYSVLERLGTLSEAAL